MPGTAGGTVRCSTRSVAAATCSWLAFSLLLPGRTMLGFNCTRVSRKKFNSGCQIQTLRPVRTAHAPCFDCSVKCILKGAHYEKCAAKFVCKRQEVQDRTRSLFPTPHPACPLYLKVLMWITE